MRGVSPGEIGSQARSELPEVCHADSPVDTAVAVPFVGLCPEADAGVCETDAVALVRDICWRTDCVRPDICLLNSGYVPE